MMSVKQENICRFQKFLKLSHNNLHITGFIMNKVLNNFLWLEVFVQIALANLCIIVR